MEETQLQAVKNKATTGSTILQFIKSMEILENKKFDIQGLITPTFGIEIGV